MLEFDESQKRKLLHEEITKEIIGASFEVHRELGYGFLERVYQRALQVELVRRGLSAESERRVQVQYKGAIVGDYDADLIVNGSVVVEIKVPPQFDTRDEAQLLNELRATGIRVGLPINFGRTRAEFKRLVF
jgi:GxxExxY protein